MGRGGAGGQARRRRSRVVVSPEQIQIQIKMRMQIRMQIQIQMQMQMLIQMQMQMQMQMINMNKKLQLIDEKPDWLDLVAITKRHRRSPRDPRTKTFSVKRETLFRKEYILWHLPTHNIDSLVIVRLKANYFDSVTNLRWLSRGIFTIELPVINNVPHEIGYFWIYTWTQVVHPILRLIDIEWVWNKLLSFCCLWQMKSRQQL